MASWEEYARGSADAALWRLKGVSAAVFPRSPEREIYNNALLDRDLAPPERGAAVDAMHAAYAAVGIDSYAAWVHESDHGMRTELAGRGYTVDESTRAMGISLDDISVAVPDLDLDLPIGPRFYGSSVYPWACSAAPTRTRSTSSWHGSRVRTSRPAWPSITTAIVACSTSRRSRRLAGEGSAPRSPRASSTMGSSGCSTASLQSTGMAGRREDGR